MKRFFTFTSMAALLLLFSCRNIEQDTRDDGPSYEIAEFPVRIGSEDAGGEDSPGTRSLITVEAEGFVNAYLFAFDATTKDILVYPAHAGDMAGLPIAKAVTTKSFNWALPLNTAMDIWVVVNPGDDHEDWLNDILEDDLLTESDLSGDNFVYHCSSLYTFKAMDSEDEGGEGYGMPMSGQMNGVTLTEYGQGVNITVGRLFARYDFYFDTTEYVNEGYTINSMYMKGKNCNTRGPFFGEGRVTANGSGVPQNVMETMDQFTSSEIANMLDMSKPAAQRTATLYFLENKQGNLGTASAWDKVLAELGEQTLRCATYAEFRVAASKDGNQETFDYRVYLGKTDMRSNFDVERNYKKTVRITLKPIHNPVDPGAVPYNGFTFINADNLVVTPGGTLDVQFETNLDRDDITASSSNSTYLTFAQSSLVTSFSTSNSTGKTRYAYSGTMRFVAPAQNLPQTRTVTSTGGKITEESSRDEATVTIQGNTVVLNGISFDSNSESIYLGETVTLQVRGHYTDGSSRLLNSSEVSGWTSSAPSCVEVNAQGVATGLESDMSVPVTATVTVDGQNYTATTTVNMMDLDFYITKDPAVVPALGGPVQVTVHSASQHPWYVLDRYGVWWNEGEGTEWEGVGTQTTTVMFPANGAHTQYTTNVRGVIEAGRAGDFETRATINQQANLQYNYVSVIVHMARYQTVERRYYSDDDPDDPGHNVWVVKYGVFIDRRLPFNVTITDSSGGTYYIPAGDVRAQGDMIEDDFLFEPTSSQMRGLNNYGFVTASGNVTPWSSAIDEDRFIGADGNVYVFEPYEDSEGPFYDVNNPDVYYNMNDKATYTLTFYPHTDKHNQMSLGYWELTDHYAFTISTTFHNNIHEGPDISYNGKDGYALVNGQSRPIQDVVDYIEMMYEQSGFGHTFRLRPSRSLIQQPYPQFASGNYELYPYLTYRDVWKALNGANVGYYEFTSFLFQAYDLTPIVKENLSMRRFRIKDGVVSGFSCDLYEFRASIAPEIPRQGEFMP